MRSIPDITDSSESREGSKAERITALRRVVEGLHSIPAGAGSSRGPAGTEAFLAAGLPGPGLIGGVLNEAIADHGDRPTAFGFLFALMAAALQTRAGPAVFVAARRAMDFGAPYGHGLRQLGIDVGRLILVETNTDKDALWAIEDALRSEARPAIVTGAVAGSLDLTQSRRLNLAAAIHATPLMLLRGAKVMGTSAAATRWRIASLPAARNCFGTFTHRLWHVTLERCRNGRTGAWTIEWDPVARRFPPTAERTKVRAAS